MTTVDDLIAQLRTCDPGATVRLALAGDGYSYSPTTGLVKVSDHHAVVIIEG